MPPASLDLDLFRGLVPLAVHESASLYSERKAGLVRAAVDVAETLDVALASLLDNTKLRAILEQVGGGGPRGGPWCPPPPGA